MPLHEGFLAVVAALLVLSMVAFMLIAGALGGIALAVSLAWAWLRYGQRVNLAVFFQATSMFLVLFALQLFLYAFHEFTEANAIPGIDNAYWHLATEDWAEGMISELVTGALVLVPLAWIAWSALYRTGMRRA